MASLIGKAGVLPSTMGKLDKLRHICPEDSEMRLNPELAVIHPISLSPNTRRDTTTVLQRYALCGHALRAGVRRLR